MYRLDLFAMATRLATADQCLTVVGATAGESSYQALYCSQMVEQRSFDFRVIELVGLGVGSGGRFE
jgi:hypothetical protein